MHSHPGGAAVARATDADTQDPVLLRIADDLREARQAAAESAEKFAALCRSGSAPPGQLARAASDAYLRTGRVLALSNRLSAP